MTYRIGPEHAELHFPDNDSSIEGAVIAWDPPRLVEFDWNGGTTQPQGSRVRFEITTQGSTSRLMLTHSRAVGPAAADFAAGWHRHPDTLTFLANGTEPPSDRPTWAQLHECYRNPARPTTNSLASLEASTWRTL